ncbi:MAG: right-handed parallel beta-helix repeat-containing protein [Gammaproteobacteria bacterium]|nr:right-handed parallel beta-helix repeat-containing protein [Gammaproteobacteria bacterium]
MGARLLTVLLGVAGPLAALAADIHVDPSRATGCPGSGSLEDPYCDWSQVREFAGGNRYLQRSGTLSGGSLKIVGKTGASADKPVFIGAYQAGPRPRMRVENPLVGGLEPANWKRIRGDVWVFDTRGFRSGDPEVLLLDQRRAFGKAREERDLCEKQGSQVIEWLHRDGTLFLCSPRGNPATVYPTIAGMQQFDKRESWAPIYIENQRHIIIDGLAVEGGSLGSIEIRGTSADIEIRNSVIGLDGASGIRAQSFGTPISRLDIHDNVIDSGIRWGMVGYEPHVSGEGVHFVAGVQDSRIYRNQFIAWSHNGMYLDAHWPESPGVRRNIVYDNEFHCGPASSYFDYCRPFGVDGLREHSVRDNLLFRNRMHDFSVAAQINGNDNYFIGNICYNTINSKAKSYPTGQCFSLQPYVWSRDNLVANNTMVNMADVAVQFIPGVAGVSAGHRIVNNIMVGCGRATLPTRRDACIAIAADASVGPQQISNNLMYNPGRQVRVLYRQKWSEDLTELKARFGDAVGGNLVADPRFRDPARDDFDLLPGSPAAGAGLPLEVPGLSHAGAGMNIGAGKLATGAGWEIRP